MLEENFQAALHSSLHRPLLVFGGEQKLTLMWAVPVGTLVFALLSSHPLPGIVLGIVLWSTGSWGLSRAAAYDPQLSQTGIRALRYRRHYRATTTPFGPFREWK